MFELFHHAMHMKAHAHHFTQLMPEEDRQDYQQPHNPGICTQFRVSPRAILVHGRVTLFFAWETGADFSSLDCAPLEQTLR